MNIFFLEVRKCTGRPVLLLLGNAPSHFDGPFEHNGVRVHFFLPNCTSWKQPMDQGIIAALKNWYKYLYLKDGLKFSELEEDEEKRQCDVGKNKKRCYCY